MELFGGEDFAGAGVAGGLEGGEEGFVGMDFVGEALPSVTLLCLGKVQASLTLRSTFAMFACGFLATAIKIGHGEVLLVLVHNTEIID